MFPSVRNKDQPLKDKVKQKQWDQRGAKTNIPDYSPIRDKHTGSYKKTLMTNKGRSNEYDSLRNQKVKKKTYFQHKLQLMTELKQIHPNAIDQIRQYQDSMNKNQAPNFYSYFCLLPFKNITDPKGKIHQQMKKLKQKASSFHRISTVIRARDECLQRLYKNLLTIKQSEILKKKQQLKEQISHLRLLTANVIDEIKAWRQEIGDVDQKIIYYSQNHKNYLIELLNDNKFIFNSGLSSYINFGEKNDPFVIAPMKKAQDRQQSPFLDILQVQKQMAYYQKYMQYLATQKAQELNSSMSQSQPQKKQQQTPQKRTSKSNSVTKIYGSVSGNHSKADQAVIQQQKYEDEDVKGMQMQKNREQRLKKNQEKINAIKSIYQTYASKKTLPKTDRKIPETDVEGKINTFRNTNKRAKSRQMRDSDDNGFDGLVKLKVDFQKVKQKNKKNKQPSSLKKQASSLKKLPKNQQKMIDNVREIQQTLKNKLQLVQKQNSRLEQASLSSSMAKFSRKNNDQLVKELKFEIIQKIQKQNQEKDKIRKKKKQQQERALQQIKLKMKKQMEQKLQQKKREKMIEREELEKRLKQEEDRLNNQRNMEIQLQIKLNKERQMRELEKIRRQSLQKQKKFREELEKEQKLRRERQQEIYRQKRQKQKLIDQLKKKQLKQQIQSELKKQMSEKRKEEDEETYRLQLEALKKQKQGQLMKQIQLLKLKQKDELSVFQKQAAIRERMLTIKKQQQQLKRKEVEYLMRTAIQRDKEQIEHEALQKRISLEQQMRNNIKQKMLQQYRAERQNQIQVNRTKRQKQVQQQVYRDKIRQKIERQMRIETINRTKKQLDDKQQKKYQVRTKLDNIKSNIEASHVIDKSKIEEDVKKQLIERVIFDKQAERQNAKTSLRSQFQRQLLSSAIPQIYQPKDSFTLKNTQYLNEDSHLSKTMQANKPTNQRPGSREGVSQNTRKSGFKDVRSLITNQQLQIYSKQKHRISQIQQQRDPEKPKKFQQEQEEGFELMNKSQQRNNRGNSEGDYDIKIIRKQKAKKQEEQKYEKKKSKKSKKNRKQQSQESVDSEDKQVRRHKKSAQKKKKKAKRDISSEQQSEMDSEDAYKIKAKKHKLSSKKKKRVKKQAVSSQLSSQQSREQSPVKRKIEFGTSEEDRKPIKKSIMKKSKYEDAKQEQDSDGDYKHKAVVHYDATQKSNIKQPNLAQIEPITIKNKPDRHGLTKQTQNNNRFEISLEAIPEQQLDQYIEAHFANLPEQQIDILTHNREDLYRRLINELTFCLLLGHAENKLGGMAIAYHDRSRSDIRKFIVVHVATYKEADLKDFILSVTSYIFKKDPCDQIQFNYHIDESSATQLAFSNQFNKWFDKYGNVYQKKVQNQTYERKYVLKRQFNQKCDVVLGGVNKNTFRNIFSVYSGVVMSDADLVQFKEQLKDVISPQDDVSYAIMIAELFRTYLTPDQAEALKGKVKQFAKLKQLLVLVVMLQKKKVKMDELKLHQFKSLIQLNMRLMSQGKDVIRYAKDSGVDMNRVFYCQLNHGFNLPFNFQTTSLPVQTKQNQIRQISYFRLSPLPPHKLHIIKSSIYNGQMNILPTQNSKYKLFIMNAQQYMEMKQRDESKLDLFMYIRLFLKNVKSHNVASWKYVWMPEMTDKGAWSIREFRTFLKKDIYAHDSVNISYRQFLPGALIIQPQHRDLVITPPFIVGIMSMTLQQITQGSPLYARLIDIDALRTLQIQQ